MLPIILGVLRGVGAVAVRGAAKGIAATARVAVKGVVAGAKAVGKGIAVATRAAATGAKAIGRGVAVAARGAGKAINAIGKAARKGVATIARGVGKAGTTSGDRDEPNEYEETESPSESDATPQSANNTDISRESDSSEVIKKSEEASSVDTNILQAISNQISILRKTVEGYESLLFKKEQSSEAADIEKDVIEDATKEDAKPKKEDKKSEGLIKKLLAGLLFSIFSFLPNIMKFFKDSKKAIKALPQKIIDSFKGIIDSISGVIKEYVVDPIVKFFKVDVGAALNTLFIFIGDKIEAIMDFPKRLMNAALMKLNELMTDAITTFLPIIKRFLPDDYIKTIEAKLGTLKAEKGKLEEEKTTLNERQVAREKTTIPDTFEKQQAERQTQYDKEHPPTGGTGQVAKPEREVNVPKVQGMDDVKAMVKRHEGVRKQAYKDSVEKWTIGVGHLIGNGSSQGEYAGRTLTDKEVDDLFEEDFAKHVKIAEKTPGWNLANDAGKAAMIDLAFNMGYWWKKWPNTAKAFAEGNFDAAAAGLKDSKWYTQVGDRAKEIVALVKSGKGGSGGESTGTAVAEAPAGVGEQIGAKPKSETATTPQVAVVVPPASPTGGNAGGKKPVSKPDPNQVQRMYAQGLGMPGTA